MRKISRLLFISFVVFMMIFGAMRLPGQQLIASAKTEASADITLNVKSKNLYLGTKGKDSFVFRVNPANSKDVKQYQWQILQDKGDPKAITIQSDTGKVTAKKAGTAYIRCKLKLKDRTLYSEEAKVIIINNITKVGIGNVPENQQITVGKEYDFNEVILDTSAGTRAKTSDITRWEIKEDTAGVEAVTADGIVTPKKEGKFRIRAVSFQNTNAYEAWLRNKKKDTITASSDWVTITALTSEGVASTQEQLDALLSTNHVKQIKFSSKESLTLTIGKGDYSDKTLMIEAPNIAVKNYGTFKQITINKAKDTIWEEYASNNSLEINDGIISLSIPENTNVNSITFGSSAGATPYYDEYVKKMKFDVSSIINRFSTNNTSSFNYAVLLINGSVDKLITSAATSYDIRGKGKLNYLELQDTADGTRIATSIAPVLDTKADYTLALFDGAEAIELKIPIGIRAIIENFMYYPVVARFGVANFRTVSFNSLTQINEQGNSDFAQAASSCSVIKLSPNEAPKVTATSVPKGQMLYSSTLTGEFSFKTITIEGMLYWEKPDTAVEATGFYMWTFVPFNIDHFSVLHGHTKVTVTD